MIDKLNDENWILVKEYNSWKVYQWLLDNEDFYEVSTSNLNSFTLTFWKKHDNDLYSYEVLLISSDIDKIIEEWKEHLNES